MNDRPTVREPIGPLTKEKTVRLERAAYRLEQAADRMQVAEFARQWAYRFLACELRRKALKLRHTGDRVIEIYADEAAEFMDRVSKEN